MKKDKDIYYIPNFYDKSLNIEQLIELRRYIENGSNFNILMFFDEFGNDDPLFKNLVSHLDVFNSSQIIRDY